MIKMNIKIFEQRWTDDNLFSGSDSVMRFIYDFDFMYENGKYLLPITWTVTIDTTNGEIPAGEYLYDKMDGYPSDDMYMT